MITENKNNKKFCANCGQKLSTDLFSKISGKKVYEFSDGWYCELCARAKVDTNRKNIGARK